MSSEWEFEPVEDGVERDQGEELEGKLFVACAGASVSFEALQEALHAVVESVVAAKPAGRVFLVPQAGVHGQLPDSQFPSRNAVES